MAAFRSTIEAGAGIECDVRLSADDQLLIFHDHDLRRMCASALTVETASAELPTSRRLFDTNEHIPSLVELLDLVASRVAILIELKTRGGNAGQIAGAAAAALNGYTGPVGVISFDPQVGKWLARHAPGIRRGLVISRHASAFDRWRCEAVASPQFLAVDYASLSRPWVARQKRKRWVYSWTIRDNAERQTAAVHADALIWESDGRPGS